MPAVAYTNARPTSINALAAVPSSSSRKAESGRRVASITTPAAPASSRPAQTLKKSPPEATTITPKAASIGMASPMDIESSAPQSATAIPTAAASSTAALTNRANRSTSSAPPKYARMSAPTRSSIASATRRIRTANAGSDVRQRL